MTLLRHHDWCYTLNNITINPKTNSGEVIKVVWGETGYYSTAFYASQTEVDEWNRERDIYPWEAEAMSTCSIFGNWSAYDSLAASLHEKMTEKGLA